MDDYNIEKAYDDVTEMIEDHAKTVAPMSLEELFQSMQQMADQQDEGMTNDPWIERYNSLPSYKLDVIRDGSDMYYQSLTDAILASTKGNYGSIEYKGYKIYYDDTPQIKSISLVDGQREYMYWIRFCCDALSSFPIEEYTTDNERKAFLNPKDELFTKTLALLDEEIRELDDGRWIKERKKLNLYEFKDYSSEKLRFKEIEWDDRNKDAANTLSFLVEDALTRAKDCEFSEKDFEIFADVTRRMVFFADYGKRNYLFELQGLIDFTWKPTKKRNKYIWRCMKEFGQGDFPDRLLDNCTLYYLLEDPKGWEALAYLFPIIALWEMCHDYEPDVVKDRMLKMFDLIPNGDYRERIEKLIAEDRSKAEQGGILDD